VCESTAEETWEVGFFPGSKDNRKNVNEKGGGEASEACGKKKINQRANEEGGQVPRRVWKKRRQDPTRRRVLSG